MKIALTTILIILAIVAIFLGGFAAGVYSTNKLNDYVEAKKAEGKSQLASVYIDGMEGR